MGQRKYKSREIKAQNQCTTLQIQILNLNDNVYMIREMDYVEKKD